MTVFEPISSEVQLAANQERRLRILTHVLYALYAVCWLTGGISALAAIIINYVKREDTIGTFYASHFKWQMRTFWWSIAWVVVSLVVAFTFILMFISIAMWWGIGIWALYRVIKGWVYLYDRKPMYRAAANTSYS